MRIKGLSTDFSAIQQLEMMGTFPQEFIFGRAVFVCEQLHVLTTDADTFATSPKFAAAATEETYRLFIPHICDRDYSAQWSGNDEKVTGILVLEALMKQALCTIQAFPCGLLVFRCDRVTRDNLICAAEFSNLDIVRGHVQLVWFLPEDVHMLHNRLQMESPWHPWEMLWSWACRTLASRRKISTNAFPVNAFHFQLWTVLNILTTWSKKVGSWNSSDNQCPPPRHMTPLEHMWLFFHVVLRLRRDTNVDTMTVQKILQEVTITTRFMSLDSSELEYNQVLKDNHIGAEMKIHQWYHGLMAKLTGLYPGLVDHLCEKYLELCRGVQESRRAVKRNLMDSMQDVRKRFAAFPIYTSCQLKSFTEESIARAPKSQFDYAAVERWSLERKKKLLEIDMNPDMVFSSVYQKAEPVYEKGDKNLLRLYGNANAYVGELKKIKETVPLLSYAVERLGSLSSGHVKPLRLYSMGSPSHPARENTPLAFDPKLTNIQKRLLEASEHCTPIWAKPVQAGTSMCFERIVPVIGARKEPGKSMESLLTEHMYPPAASACTNEYLQSGLHWSSFVADIDIKVSENPDIAPPKDIARDAVKLFDGVFETLFPGEKVKRHLVFASAGKKVDKKIGLHHHAILPPGLVFTSTACRDLAQILETARHLYPDTIGMAPIPDCPVYDLAIYPIVTQSGQNKGHCFRGPFQTKADGSRKLECIYDSQENAISLNDMLVHGAQFNEDIEGGRVLYGRVVNAIQGAVALSDMLFFRNYEANIMDRNIRTVCKTAVTDIAEEINKRTVLFQPNTNPVPLLLAIINNLWQQGDGKKLMLEHMECAVGRLGKKYDRNWIRAVHQHSRFVHDTKTNSIVLALKKGGTLLPFCPRKPHNSSVNEGITIRVGYYSKAIRFVLLASRCFKSSCRGTYFLPKVVLSMPNIFIAPVVQSQVIDFLKGSFVGTRVRVIHVDAWHEDRKEEEETVHDGQGIYSFVPKGTFSNIVRQLYMFVANELVACSLVTNINLVCFVRDGQSFVIASREYPSIIAYLAEKKSLTGVMQEMLAQTSETIT